MDRRAFTFGALALTAASPQRVGRQIGFIGCYTNGQGPTDFGVHPDARGIYSFELDGASGKLSDLRLAAECPSPTNLILSPQNRTLYAGQGGNFASGQAAGWNAYRVAGKTLRLIGSAPAGGTGPTHGMVDRRGRFLVTTNFSSNEVMVFKLAHNGNIVDVAARIAPTSPDTAPPPPPGTPLPPMPQACRSPARTIADNCRTKPHIALLSPREKWLVVAEIATDALAIYRMDHRSGKIELERIAPGQEGGGPRHLVFSPDGRFLYSSDEHGSAVSAWSWNEATGEARHIQALTTLPAGYSGRNTTSHIAIHPLGRALWVANRGSPTIACYRTDPASGRLTQAGHAPTGGRDCWCFAIDASGRWLVAGSVSGDFLQAYRIDPVSGGLTPQGSRLAASFPTCVAL